MRDMLRSPRFPVLFLSMLFLSIAVYSSQNTGSISVGGNSSNFNEVQGENQEVSPSQAIAFNAVDATGWSLSFQEKYLLSSFEGLVNHNMSELFIVRVGGDPRWLQDLNVTPYVASWVNASNMSELFSLYSSHIEGIIIWDDLPESGNVGTPLSGIHNSVMVHSSLWSTVSTWPALSGKPITVNLTAEYESQGFNSSTHPADIYRWAFDSYYSQCNQSALGMFDATSPDAIRSQLLGNGIFTMWQPMFCYDDPERDHDDEKQVETFEYILNNSAQNIVVYGYMFPRGCNEHPVVRRLTENGKFLIPTDWFNHMSFWQNLPLPLGFTFDQEASREISSIPLENKVYVAGIYSDGDNLQYVANFMKGQLWDDKHGAVPTTYEMSPSIFNLAPGMAMVYYKQMTTNDYFVNGVGGKGYVKSGYASDWYFNTFWRDTRDLMAALDQQEVRTWDSGDTMRIVNIMNNELGTTQADSIIEGYGGGSYIAPYTVGGVPFLHMLSYGAENASEYEGEKQMLLDILSYKPSFQPIFITLHLHCWSAPYDVWEEFVNIIESESNGKIVFVTSGQLSGLMATANLDLQEQAYSVVNLLLLIGIPGLLAIIVLLKPKKGKKSRRSPRKEAIF
ncbi:MAG: hypothetical protein ACFFCS_05850 [Candidatus Hodarchaeota archaeon]